ncbi:MAG: carbohydrate ABC transporter permease [Lachnospiraceae bacterium]|jgi:putative aldouronate transport system permease protein|nr:carbohydrate ABC transporter permease [uncultured Acetatifactor sp.]MCI9230588.1 carbohydrate ABC transporter permease [Lachnospiraceae bacterium]MCI9572796.1 carbohydrate ABC transporter permease [Lachnospiraceae bacterium]
MKVKRSVSFYIYQVFNTIVLTLMALSCILPILHVFAMSLSSSSAAMAGRVGFVPVEFSLKAYEYLISKKDFFHSVSISLARVLVGTVFNMAIIAITAYPLSRSSRQFRARTAYMAYFAVTMFIGGGLIPTYMVIKNLHLLDSFWVLILPSAMSIWNVIIMMNFIKGLPRAIEEAAFVDGANHWQTLIRVILPMSKPSLASLLLFSMIGHWNAWFDGMFYMNNPNNYPMATYLATQVINNNQTMTNMTPEQLALLSSLSEKTVRSAQMFIAIIPILVVYPFLQKFFVKGITVGSVKE